MGHVGWRAAVRAAASIDFLLHGLPALPVEISERFSSSSLPPSFALGRRAAIFMQRGIVDDDAPFVWAAR